LSIVDRIILQIPGTVHLIIKFAKNFVKIVIADWGRTKLSVRYLIRKVPKTG